MSAWCILVVAANLHAYQAGDDKKVSAEDRRALADVICTAAATAVQGSDFARTDCIGSFGDAPIEDIPKQGGVLIGARIGVGKFVNTDVLATFEPIFLTTRGEVYGKLQGKGRGGGRTKVKKTVIQRAKNGYAVGAMKVKAGLYINGVQFVYMRMSGEKLDPADTYEGDWVGSLGGSTPKILGGSGDAAIGMRGVVDNTSCRSLGLILMGKDSPTDTITGTDFRRPNARKKSNRKETTIAKMPERKTPETKTPRPEPAKMEPAALPKTPKTSPIDKKVSLPAGDWEAYRQSKKGDFAEYDRPTLHRIDRFEVVEVGDRWVVVRERILPNISQTIVLRTFDGPDPTDRPTPSEVDAKAGGKTLKGKLFEFTKPGAKDVVKREIYSAEVPVGGLVMRQTATDVWNLTSFARGQ